MPTPDKHKNSRKIHLLRKNTFSDAAQTLAADFMSMSKKSIGSYFESKQAQTMGSGLDFEERKLLIPHLIDVPAEDRSFLEKCKEYFGGLVTKVPFGDEGTILEIGLLTSNSEPVSASNMPINIAEYVRYRHAKGHPKVAASKADATGNMLVDFYIYDPTEDIQETAKANTKKDEAMAKYLQIKADEDKVDAMLTLFGEDVRTYTGPGIAEQKREALRQRVLDEAPKFMEHYEDKHFEERYLLKLLVTTGVVKRIGAQYVNAESGKILGHTEEEAIYYLKDTNNSDQISFLKSQLQEARRREVKGRKRVPISRV